jgi:CO/xanthine dehydrogenase FAD-binding subunit
MPLPEFEFLRPKTLDEALEMLSVTPGAMPVAGGTNLVPDLRKGTYTPGAVIDISKLPEICCIRRQEGHLLIGGAVRIAELLEDPMVAEDAPILVEMARSFANVLIRNRATVGGNLVNAAPCCDSAPALLVLDAEVELASLVGTRRLPLAEFLIDAFVTKRQSSEILTCVRVPIPSGRSSTAFEKMGLRKISCMAKVDVAVLVESNDEGVCETARIALGAASPVALRATEAESALVGRQLDPNSMADAAERAASAIVPRTGSEYKRQVVRGLTRRLLAVAAERGGR